MTPDGRAPRGGAPRDSVRLAAEATRRAVEAALRRLAGEGLPTGAVPHADTGGSQLARQASAPAGSSATGSLVRAPGDAAAKQVLILDVGGRGRPYASLTASALGSSGYGARHIVADPGPHADLAALAEDLPLLSGSVGLVLCTQVLEHVADPAAAVKEMARVLRPGGACLLTTHGTWFYHPDPEDYWRWTGAGLRRLFVQAGFTSVDVRPAGGTKLALAALVSTALRRAPGGAVSRAAQRLLAAPVEWFAGRLWLDVEDDRRCVEGELALNYVVTARQG